MRYFLVLLLFVVLAIGGIVLYAFDYIVEAQARMAFAIGFSGALVTIAVHWIRKSARHPDA